MPSRINRREFTRLAALGAASLTAPRFAFAADAAEKQTHVYKKLDDVEIQADVYNAAPGGKRPT
ncbi:MAG TPA: hypothetical protein VGN42_18290, partial [Pirellulales bacterium]|nr:hypothetical protein [Pirellulales bacterium]